MDVSILKGPSAIEAPDILKGPSLEQTSRNSSRKRRMELPLKKRYQTHESTNSYSLINRSSPIDDRASSDDSALPKTPCSARSISSGDAEDVHEFALDFTLPNRSRAKLRSIFSIDRDHDHGIDHGFESASTSSVTSAQEEPLDLTEKSQTITSLQNHRSLQSISPTSISIAQFPLSLFGSNFIPFSLTQSPVIPNLIYPDFFTQSLSSATVPKRQKLNSKSKKIDHFKFNDFSNIDDRNNDFDEDNAFLNKLKRNYKNMTVERRMEANARERTRVHTIGAAFDRLRKLVPSSTSDQKLSKLSILRIACRYIMLLASMNGLDYSLEQHGYSVQECIDMLTDTIIVESKLKRVP